MASKESPVTKATATYIYIYIYMSMFPTLLAGSNITAWLSLELPRVCGGEMLVSLGLGFGGLRSFPFGRPKNKRAKRSRFFFLCGTRSTPRVGKGDQKKWLESAQRAKIARFPSETLRDSIG